MPIEIRELHIKAVVDNASEGGGGASAQGGTNNTSGTEQLIKACVEKVIEIIQDAKER